MGKRKQKVQWCKVDGLHWSNEDQAETSPEGSAGVVKGEAGTGTGSGGTRRSSAQGWTSALAPRFERKAAAEAEQKHIYYEGEFCEAEELPNGFTKIRSKNLDILFKRDYYEQRLAAQQQISEKLKILKNTEKTEEDCCDTLDEDQKEKADTSETFEIIPTNKNMGSIQESNTTAKSSSRSFDQIDPNEVLEFKPMNAGPETSPCDMDSGHTSPFYGNYPPYHPQEYPAGPQYSAPARPNLYLYSPSNNSLIPCEEIIIPNPVMSPEGPVYSGPTNIYLAYPVQGPDGRGYITQPFAPPGSAGSYMSQDSSSYSPSISYDGSNSYSSTPQTPNSGQDSGSSTQPTSPPPLDNYHPTDWINQDPPTLIHPLPTHTEGYYDPQPVDISADNPPHSLTTIPAAAPVTAAPGTLLAYIPGLSPPSIIMTPKKSQKRRKRKTKTESLMEHRGSTSSESEFQKFLAAGECNSSEQLVEEFVPEVVVEPVHEIHLTDDLADSLVNPPTDPEGSEDEISHHGLLTPATLKENEEKVNESNYSIVTNVAVTSTNNEVKMDMKVHELELEDKEVTEILETIKSDNSVNVVSEVNNELVKVVTVQNSIDDSKGEIIENISSSESERIQSKNTLYCASPSKGPVKGVDKQREYFDESIETECVLKVEECVRAKDCAAENDEENVPCLEQNGKKLRNRNKKHKKIPQLVLNTSNEFDVNLSNSEDKIASQNDCPAEIKKSYSSVIKANLVKASNNNNSIPSQAKVDTAPVSSPLPTKLSCPAIQTITEQEPDNWEKVPVSISKPENWEKTSKKRKHKNKSIRFEDSSLPEEMPELEALAPLKESPTPVEVENVVTNDTVIEENTIEDEIEQEKKKLRRRKKKNGSEEPEESNAGHRVVICDEQISIRYSQAVRRASELLSPSLLDTVKTSGYCDFLMVNELGLGISRGCMDFGRLYQGKYVPPERIDGLLPELEETECEEEEETGEEFFFEDSCITESTDIDLD
eukprot:GFUD01015587.1.p1 GENE.GFUD01015587.1~~GFUD01015587.1.p1  ORF type:complete len:991 (+),score=328.13 GFUD01015587.1:343-3315(+)